MLAMLHSSPAIILFIWVFSYMSSSVDQINKSVFFFFLSTENVGGCEDDP